MRGKTHSEKIKVISEQPAPAAYSHFHTVAEAEKEWKNAGDKHE